MVSYGSDAFVIGSSGGGSSGSKSRKPLAQHSSGAAANHNEWGIPTSDALPPLFTSSTKGTPLPHVLPNGGTITLVGSGPGDPDLLTMKAYKLLTQKDPNVVVVADRLVSRAIINLIPGQVHIARKLPGCAELAQEEIYWWCYQALQQGKHVVRLKIGDPFVFGRGGEEVLKFREFGVEATVVPVSTESLWMDDFV
jgi:hypothetical protein